MPVSVSIADTLDPEPEYICSKDPEELIRLFYQPPVHRSEAIREDVTQKYMPPDLEGLTKDQQNLINQWCEQVPVIGFNSGRYDVHLNRKYFVSHLGQENGVFAGEKQGQIMYISTAQFWLKLPKFSATFGKGSLFFFCLLQQIGCRKVFNLLKKKKLNYIYIYIYIYTPNTMEAKWATLESMGLRSVEAVAKHILQENVWENNLIPGIAGVDYFAGHQGRTNLQPLDGLPAFVDDFYVYGPLRENEIVRVRGRKPACTTGEEGSGKRVVSQISLFVRQVWGCEDGFKNVSIAHTVYANFRSSRIIETVEKIEKETGYRARRRWNELYPNENPAAYFAAKVDVSELLM